MDSPLDKKLSDVEWGEYEFQQIFNRIEQGRRLKKEDQLPGNIPFVMAGITNTGVINYISNPVASFPKNSITVDIFGNTFYRDYDFGAGDDTGVYWNDDVEYSKDAMLFFAVAMQKALLGRFSYGKKLRSSQSLKFKMMLPVKNDRIDFEFISSFIKELEAERIKELEAYLKVTGFDNYELTKEEQDSLAVIEAKNVLWREFKMEELFEKIPTIKLPYKAKELPEEATNNFVLPCLTSSFKNQGLNYYAPKDGATILKDVISIPSNSDVYRAYFQSNEFTVLSDAYAIRWKDKSMHISQNQYLFMVMCINKFTDLPIYSYKNKLGGWNVVKNKYVLLPVKKDKIDFDFMEAFINAIKKLTLKNVADYADKRIAATKEVISNY
ncbi:restriction endonuclease subunit S [Phocaeicola sartorii]|uniref:restriction endonuclease subunit S n=1 Tax=Phocaeicola sartorii TaxID=671267 RepID=UPI0021A9D6FF|nr:restriction endonuclease subunit S [Phocaeicola sartorii]